MKNLDQFESLSDVTKSCQDLINTEELEFLVVDNNQTKLVKMVDKNIYNLNESGEISLSESSQGKLLH